MAGLNRARTTAPAGLLISDRHTIRCHAAPDIGLLIRTAVSMSFPMGEQAGMSDVYVFSGRSFLAAPPSPG